MMLKKILFLLMLLSSISYAQNEAVAPSQEELSSSKAEGKKHYLFEANQIGGTAGGPFVGYSFYPNDKVSSILWGGRFFFSFDDFLRVGVHGGLFKPISNDPYTGYFLGIMASYLIRLDPVMIGFPLTIGQASFHQETYFNMYPQVELEVRITDSVSISLVGGYMLLVNTAVLNGDASLVKQSQPTGAIYITFGTF